MHDSCTCCGSVLYNKLPPHITVNMDGLGGENVSVSASAGAVVSGDSMGHEQPVKTEIQDLNRGCEMRSCDGFLRAE